MNQPLVCLTLTGKTLDEDLMLVKKYENQIDMVELRVDYLNSEEQFYVKRFPSLINHPCILTIRRDIDGGLYASGEFSRTSLFARALAFANTNHQRNFAYVEFEDDFHIPSIQDAAMAFGVKIIRSHYSINEPISNIRDMCESMRKTGFEIPKICFKADSVNDLGALIKQGQLLTDYEHILYATGPVGYPSRILSGYTNSLITYVDPDEDSNANADFTIDPSTLLNLYNFRNINENTKLYGITGWPLNRIVTPTLHNYEYQKQGLNAVYFPIRSKLISESLNFAEQLGMNGLTVTSPFKESVLSYLNDKTEDVKQIGACNLIIRRNNRWLGYNTDVFGFRSALLEFTGEKFKFKKKKVAVIGAGAVAKAVVFVLNQLGAKVCIFNRSVEHAQQIASKFNCKSYSLDTHSVQALEEYSSLIIQTTSLGESGDFEPSNQNNDPLYFYKFHGHEMLFDVNFAVNVTPVMKRALAAGCSVCNGYKMLEYQTHMQFKFLTDKDFEL